VIVSNNIPPEKNLYYLGSKILKSINKNGVNILALYNAVNKNGNMNFVLFTYTLDWLYIVDMININEKGIIYRCS